MSLSIFDRIHPEGPNQIASLLQLGDWNNMRQINKRTHQAMQKLPKTAFEVNIVTDEVVGEINRASIKKIENIIRNDGRLILKFDVETDPFVLSAYLGYIERIENLSEQMIHYFGTGDVLSRGKEKDPDIIRVQNYLISLISQK